MFEPRAIRAAATGKSQSISAVLGGLLIAFALFSTGSASGQMTGHGAHPLMPNQNFVLSYSTGGTLPNTKTVAIDVANPSAEAALEQEIELPPGWPALRITRFLPQADLRQVVIADEDGKGKPAVQLAITGPTQSFERWLIADDVQHNRLASFIGTWRFMAVADRALQKKLLKQFEGELTREPKLLIRNAGKDTVEELPAVAGKTVRLEEFNTFLRVIDFYPHFGVDQATKKPVNQSDKRVNPAALVEIDVNGSKREEWFFSRFPEYRRHQDEPLLFRLSLDCPSSGSRSIPDYLIVATNGKKCDLAARHEDKTSFRSLGLGDSVEVSGSQYRFSISSMLPSGQLTEVYEPSKGKAGVPAIRVEIAGASEAIEPVWLGQGKQKVISTSSGPITLTLHLDERQATKGHP